MRARTRFVCLSLVLLVHFLLGVLQSSPGAASQEDNGMVFAFGANAEGQLGDGTFVQRVLPGPIWKDGPWTGNPIAFSAGWYHSLILSDTGKVYSFGYNSDGGLGDGTTRTRIVPFPVFSQGVLNGVFITSISAGPYHSLVLSDTGRVFSWGYNYYGQLGDNSKTDRNSPVEVYSSGALSGVPIIAISAGEYHSLVLSDAGQVFGFGNNQYCAVGDSSYSSYNTPTSIDTILLPVGITFTAIAAGAVHSLALASTGFLYSWGNGDHGQLGDGTTNFCTLPHSVDTTGVFNGVTISAISAGAYHSLVLSDTGRVFSFGHNQYGQLGDGTEGMKSSPVTVSTNGPLNGTVIKAIAAGSYHSMVLSDTGRVFSFGQNEYGQLGDGTTTNRLTPVAVNMQTMPSGINVTRITGGYHNLMLSDSGLVFSFGWNDYGQLGLGTLVSTSSPKLMVPQGVTFGINITAIASTSRHTLLLTDSGTVFSFGQNSGGQLGDGTATNRAPAVAVVSSGVLDGVTVVAISAGWDHSLVLSNAGLVYSFGYNNNGQLGDDTFTSKSSPVAVVTYGVLSGVFITAISAGGAHSLVLSAAGLVYSFGRNYNGQLGHGSTTDQKNPVAVRTDGVLNGRTIIEIEAGGSHSLLFADNGKLYSFGANSYGQLGDGSVSQRTLPVSVIMDGALSGVTITAIACGDNHCLVLSAVGQLFAFGQNDYGQLGDGSAVSKSSPVAVIGLDNIAIAAISCGDWHSLAVSESGQAFTFGLNNNGQLGDGSTSNRYSPVEVDTTGSLDGVNITAVAGGSYHSVVLSSANRLVLSPISTGYTADDEFSLTVQIQDPLGNPIPDSAENVTISGDNLVGGGLKQLVSGAISFSNLTVRVVGQNYRIKASCFGVFSAFSNTFNVTHGALAKVQLTQQPIGAQPGDEFSVQPRVALTDSWNNPITGAVPGSIVASIASGYDSTANLQGVKSLTPSNGVVQFTDLSIDKVGTYKLQFTYDLNSSFFVTSEEFVVVPLTPTQIEMTSQPGYASAGLPFVAQPSIRARGQNNTLVNGANFTATIISGGSPSLLQGTTKVVTLAGDAQFVDLRIDQVGVYTLRIAYSENQDLYVDSLPFRVNAAAPTNLGVSVQPANATAGMPFAIQPIVQVYDTFGNLVGGVSITAALIEGGDATLLQGTKTIQSLSNGIAEFVNLRIDKVGTYRLQFSSQNMTVTSEDLDVESGEPAFLAILTQPGQASAGQSFAIQPLIEVNDTSGNLVEGVAITASLIEGGDATLLQGTKTVVTSVEGTAAFTNLGIQKTGTYKLQFSYGSELHINSTEINVDEVSAAPNRPLMLVASLLLILLAEFLLLL